MLVIGPMTKPVLVAAILAIGLGSFGGYALTEGHHEAARGPGQVRRVEPAASGISECTSDTDPLTPGTVILLPVIRLCDFLGPATGELLPSPSAGSS